jgi:hypothetical protein
VKEILVSHERLLSDLVGIIQGLSNVREIRPKRKLVDNM